MGYPALHGVSVEGLYLAGASADSSVCVAADWVLLAPRSAAPNVSRPLALALRFSANLDGLSWRPLGVNLGG